MLGSRYVAPRFRSACNLAHRYGRGEPNFCEQTRPNSAGSGISLMLRSQQDELQAMLQKMVLGQTPPHLPRTALPVFDDQENTNANRAPALPSRLAIQVPYVSPRPIEALHREEGPARAQHQLQDLVESNKAAVTALREGLLSRSGSGSYQSEPTDFLARISTKNSSGRGGGGREDMSLVASSRHFMHESAVFLPSAGTDFMKVRELLLLRPPCPLLACDLSPMRLELQPRLLPRPLNRKRPGQSVGRCCSPHARP